MTADVGRFLDVSLEAALDWISSSVCFLLILDGTPFERLRTMGEDFADDDAPSEMTAPIEKRVA